MRRPTRQELKRREDAQRNVITIKPATIAGGFPWLALAPFAAAAATPVLGSLGKWVGKKVFGEGVLRSGDRVARQPMPSLPMKGAGQTRLSSSSKARLRAATPSFAGLAQARRAGDLPQPAMVPLPHHNSPTRASTVGGFNPLGALLKAASDPMGALSNPLGLLGTGRKKKKGSKSMKDKMAKVRAAKGKGKKKSPAGSC